MTGSDRALAALAAAYGVQAEFDDFRGRPHQAPADAVRAALATLGVTSDELAEPAAALDRARSRDWRHLVPPVTVRRAFDRVGVPLHLPDDRPARVDLVLDDGTTRELEVGGAGEERELDGRRHVRRGVWLPEDLPDGYHRLRVSSGDVTAEGLVVASPRECYMPPAPHRLWGWMIQLYAVRSRRSWGLGDLADLAALARWSGETGAGFVLCNPLHAGDPTSPREPSPYFPTSRRFYDPAYLRVEDLPEYAGLDRPAKGKVTRLATKARALTAETRLRRDEAWAAKRAALLLLFDAMPDGRRAEFERWRKARGTALRDFATYCALADEHGNDWQEWPAALRKPSGRAVTAARKELAGRVSFHAWVQWCCEEQLAAAQQAARASGQPVGVIHDLAVGVKPGGADTWALPDDFATGFSVGAPPDAFNQLGQDWAQPPLRPDRLLASGLGPYREMLAAALRHGGGVRIDHAIGLFRLYWIPDGGTPADGVFVSYPTQAMLATLALESVRASGVVVAEDLGVIPEGVPETLRDWGLFSSAVMRFERNDDGWRRRTFDYPVRAFTSVTTHDLATVAGFWSGHALDLQVELELLRDGVTPEDAESELDQEREELQGVLRGEGFAAADASDEALADAMHAFIGRTPSLLAAVQLADALGQVDQQNVPGTRDEYPNWQVPLNDATGQPVLLEELPDHPAVRRTVETMRAERPRG